MSILHECATSGVVSTVATEKATRERVGPPQARSRLLPVLVCFGFLVALAIGLLAGNRIWGSSAASAPLYHEITFRRGEIRSARFAPDGQTILYSAAWQGNPVETFSARQGMVESRSLGLGRAELMAISSRGEMALLTRQSSRRNLDQRRHPGQSAVGGWRTPSRFSKMLNGQIGLPMEIAWPWCAMSAAATGSSIPSARSSTKPVAVGSATREFLPRATYVAFMDHPNQGDDGGSIAIVDISGHKTELTREWYGTQGLAWTPDGKEVWFTASELGLVPLHHSRRLSRGSIAW